MIEQHQKKLGKEVHLHVRLSNSGFVGIESEDHFKSVKFASVEKVATYANKDEYIRAFNKFVMDLMGR